MPRPCSNLMPPGAMDCLIFAQFVPSFVLVLKSCVNMAEWLGRFEGMGGAFLHQFCGRKAARHKMLWAR